jgi:cytoskeleton protein RodZ
MNEDGTTHSRPEISSGSPGAVLRRCREYHGITLEEAAETTKIGISHLKALEDDNIREFANQAYLKGFLRIYAAYLGLNADDIARLYDKLFGVKVEKSDSSLATSSRRPPHRLITLKKLVFPAILLAVIVLTAIFFKRPPPPLVRLQPAAPVVAAPVQNAAVQGIQSSVRIRSAERQIPPAPVEKSPAELPVTEKTTGAKRSDVAGTGFILKIRVTQNGTLTSTVDGSGSQQYDLTIGDVIEWKAEKMVSLDLSNAGGVDIELNGKPYKMPGPSGKPVYVEFDSDGIKQ